MIVLASQHHPYDDAKGRAAGVDDHISKPFDTQAMIDRVHQVLARPRVAPAQVAAPSPAPASAEAPKAAAAPPARPVAPPPAAPPAAVKAPQPVQPPIPAPAVGLPPPAAVAKPAAAPASSSQLTAPPVGNGLSGLESKLSGLGLSADQLAGVLALSREVIEQVVWEVVPDLAEALIKEELRRLTAD